MQAGLYQFAVVSGNAKLSPVEELMHVSVSIRAAKASAFCGQGADTAATPSCHAIMPYLPQYRSSGPSPWLGHTPLNLNALSHGLQMYVASG